MKKESNDIARSEKLLAEFMAAEEAEILRCVRAVQKAAHQRGAIMINLMKQMHEDHIEDLKNARGQVDDITKRLETVCAVVRDHMNSASDYEYVSQHQTLYANMTKQLQQKVPKSVDKNFPRIKFVSNKGTENMVNLGHLRTSNVVDVTAELRGRLRVGNADAKCGEVDRINDLAVLPHDNFALVFKSKVNVYKPAGEYENLAEQEYTLKLSLEPPAGYSNKPCWVDSNSEDTPGVWLTHGVAVLEDTFAVMDETPFVKIFTAGGKFKSMFTTMELPASSKEYRASQENLTTTSAADSNPQPQVQVKYRCITQDVDGKTIFLGDLLQNVITVHDSTGKCLNKFAMDDPPNNISVFGQRLAVTTIKDRIDVIDKLTGAKYTSAEVPYARGACVDIKSGCMFVTTADDDSFENENGKVEVYCSMAGTHMGCLVPTLYEPTGAMALLDGDRLAVVDREGVNFYKIVYTYE